MIKWALCIHYVSFDTNSVHDLGGLIPSFISVSSPVKWGAKRPVSLCESINFSTLADGASAPSQFLPATAWGWGSCPWLLSSSGLQSASPALGSGKSAREAVEATTASFLEGKTFADLMPVGISPLPKVSPHGKCNTAQGPLLSWWNQAVFAVDSSQWYSCCLWGKNIYFYLTWWSINHLPGLQ